MKFIALLCLALIVVAQNEPKWESAYEAFTQVEIKDLDGWTVRNNFKGNAVTKCGAKTLVGGFRAFGKLAFAQKSITVPPHHKLKINIQLWKLDTWDDENMYIYVDGYLWQAKWKYTEGENLCGLENSKKELFFNIEFEIPHNQPTVNILLTSNLDEEADNESWGFRDFKVSFLRCPGDCSVCTDDKVEKCYYWQSLANSWTKSEITADGWTVEGETKPEKSDCSGISIFGGINKLGRKTNLIRSFKPIPPHFAIFIKLQFWKIDTWDNEVFRIVVDETERFRAAYSKTDGIAICRGQNFGDQQHIWPDKVSNIEFSVPHNIPETKLLMTTTLDETPDNESWGVRDFYIYYGACPAGCSGCTGPSKADCTGCLDGWQLINGECKGQVTWYVNAKQFFDNELDFGGLLGWIVSGTRENNAPFSQCGPNKLFGGYNKFGAGAKAQKVFTIPPHKRVRIVFKMYKIDSWDNEEFQLFVDGKKIWNKVFGFDSPGQAKLCGSPIPTWMTFIQNIDVVLEHSASDVNVLMTSTLDEAPDNESWGFREFQLLYEPADDCVTFYSDCNYKGESWDICKDTPSLATQKIKQVRSIKIPPGLQVQGFNDENYKGQTVKFTTSQECLGDIQFSFIQTSYTLHQVDLVSNLRRLRFD